MKTFDRYVLNKTLMPLTVAIGIALIALLMERMVRLLDLVVNKGGPFYLLLQMLANLIPHYLGIALPAAFFIGVLHAVMKMSSVVTAQEVMPCQPVVDSLGRPESRPAT